MKKFVLIFCFALFCAGFALAQENVASARKLSRAEKRTARMQEVKSLIDSKQFVFYATNAQPMSGGQVNLTSQYSLILNGDSAQAYLPYFGIAYTAGYLDRNGGINFNESLKEYSCDFKKGNYRIKFEVKVPADIYEFNLSVSEEGYASLHVSCNNRQPISFNGTIEGKKVIDKRAD